MKPKEITVPIRFTFDINGAPVKADAMGAMPGTIIEENADLQRVIDKQMTKIGALERLLEESRADARTERERGDQWHAQWSAERRIIEAIQSAMVDATCRLHAIFGEDLTWDELLAAAADELENRAEEA